MLLAMVSLYRLPKPTDPFRLLLAPRSEEQSVLLAMALAPRLEDQSMLLAMASVWARLEDQSIAICCGIVVVSNFFCFEIQNK